MYPCVAVPSLSPSKEYLTFSFHFSDTNYSELSKLKISMCSSEFDSFYFTKKLFVPHMNIDLDALKIHQTFLDHKVLNLILMKS